MGNVAEVTNTGIGLTAAILAIGQPVGMIALIFTAMVISQYAVATLLTPETPSPSLEPEAGIQANTRSAKEPIKVLYGQLKIGGNDVYIGTSGANNEILWVVQTLSEGVCEGIYQDGGVDQVFLGDLIYTEYGGNVTYYFHDGASDQAVDADLQAALGEWTDLQPYTCYMVWKLTYDANYFQSLPQRTVILQGRKLFDLRDDSTSYSANAVLCMYDYLVNESYGLGFDSAKMDETSWKAAATYCDAQGWTFNVLLTGTEAAQDVLDMMCTSFRGTLTWWDGKFYLRYADLDDEASCMTLTDEHIFRDSSGKASISIVESSNFNSPDGLSVAYINPDNNYVVDTFAVGESIGVIEEFQLTTCTLRQQAADLGVYELERRQLSRSITGVFRDDAVKLEPHDIVTLNTSALTIANQLMRVTDAVIQPGGLIGLSLNYEATSLYNDDYDLSAENIYTCTLPDFKDEPPSVSNVQKTEEVVNYRLRSFTRLKVTFTAPADFPWYSHCEIYLSFDDASWTYLYDVNTDFNIENVEEGVTYYIRLKAVSIWGTKQQDANDFKISHVVGGYDSVPASLAALYAIVNANTINLYSSKVSDPDVELYEFRLGGSWSGGIFLAALRSPNLSLYGVKPGNHTFMANTLSNNALYGSTPRSAAAVLIDPPDEWAIQNTETCDYDGVGTHDNTEHVIYDVDDYLKCSHTADVLTGTYTSPIYDRGASGRYLVYLLADIVVTGTGTAWNDVMPDPDTWEEISIDTRTWVEIFELSSGPSIQIKLLYGDVSPPTHEVEKLEILSAIVTARYFQAEITITDPSSAVNALIEHFELKFCQ